MLGKFEEVGQTITPSLLFAGAQHGRAEEAIRFYTSVFSDSGIDAIHRYGRGGIDPEGSIKHAQFRLNGEAFMAMDSALEHDFGFTEAISFIVRCETQDEIDYFWKALSAVPEAEQLAQGQVRRLLAGGAKRAAGHAHGPGQREDREGYGCLPADEEVQHCGAAEGL
jgi:predicted 3-demethylubiquinone-9 3-methyltransferase (glyoxalase superfamily)